MRTANQSRLEMGAGEGTSGGRQRSNTGRPRQQGQVFAVTRQEAKATPEVVTGMLTICSNTAHVLIGRWNSPLI